MKLEAHNNYVVVEMDEASESFFSSIGFELPAIVKETRKTGRVVSVGPSVSEKGLYEGVRVLFPPYGVGEAALFGGRRFLLLLDHEILGVIDEE